MLPRRGGQETDGPAGEAWQQAIGFMDPLANDEWVGLSGGETWPGLPMAMQRAAR
jgi:hypothetical protein